MTKLIINADDFGYSKGVNYGIVDAYRNGAVTSTTIMANMPGFRHGVELLKENPKLACGVHLTLTCYKPLLINAKTLTDEKGHFFKKPTKEFIESVDLEEVYNEFCAQIDRAKKYIDITHLDSHHHIHKVERFRPVVKKLVEKYKLPIRWNFEDIDSVKTIDFVGTFYKENATVEWFSENSDKLKEYQVVDIMTHPAYLDEFLMDSSSYGVERVKELAVLKSNKVKQILSENGIVLANYKDL